MTSTGAWFLGGYRRGMVGTLGQSLALEATDNLGWALRSWKYELTYNGSEGNMVLDSPVLGEAADAQIKAFQAAQGIGADGVIGPVTGEHLLRRRAALNEGYYGVPDRLVWRIVAQESSFDIGAIGFVDQLDRGPAQVHVTSSILLSQAIRPAWAFPRLAAQLARVSRLLATRPAVASWNVGEGGAEWWSGAGMPATGSPSWWNEEKYGSLAARATKYVSDVYARTPPA